MARTPFSQRHGYMPAPIAQLEYISARLRTGLHNSLAVLFARDLNMWFESGRPTGRIVALWDECWRKSLTQLNERNFSHELEAHFGAAAWFEIFDTLEYVCEEVDPAWDDVANELMASECCAYRIVSGHVMPIIQPEQIESVEAASQGESPSAHHMRLAVESFAARKPPDYPNAVRNAIAAVEAEMQCVAGKPGLSMGDALKKCRDELPPALYRALGQLWGYSSESGGIRHAMRADDSPTSHSEAQLVIVLCSALVSFLRQQRAD